MFSLGELVIWLGRIALKSKQETRDIGAKRGFAQGTVCIDHPVAGDNDGQGVCRYAVSHASDTVLLAHFLGKVGAGARFPARNGHKVLPDRALQFGALEIEGKIRAAYKSAKEEKSDEND